MPTIPLRTKVWTFIKSIRKGRDRELQKERDEICRACEFLEKKTYRSPVTGNVKVGEFCQQCGCGTWPLADLKEGKNGWVGFNCPIGKFGENATGSNPKDMSLLINIRNRLEMDSAVIDMHLKEGTMLSDQDRNRMLGMPQNARGRQPEQPNRQVVPVDPTLAAAVGAAAARSGPATITEEQFRRDFVLADGRSGMKSHMQPFDPKPQLGVTHTPPALNPVPASDASN